MFYPWQIFNDILSRHVQEKQMEYKCEQDSSWQFFKRKYLTFKIFVQKEKKMINSLLLCLEKKIPKNMTWYI